MSAISRSARIGTWFAIAAVAVFLGWAAVRIDEIVQTIYAQSDIASAPVIAELLVDRDSGGVTLGYYPWLEPLFGLHLTRWVPSHRVFWEVEPFLILAASIALTWWSVRRTVSGRAGLLVALAMAAPAPVVIMMLGAPNMRVWVLLHATLLAAFAVATPATSSWARGSRPVWGLALAITLAPGVASDPMVIVAGVVPFVVAMAIAWRLSIVPAGAAALGAGACIAGAAGGRLLERFAEHQGITYYPQDFGPTSVPDALANAKLFLEDIALFAHGRLGEGTDPVDRLEQVVAVGMMVGVPLLLVAIAWRGWPLVADSGTAPDQRLLAVYWAVAAIAVMVAFLASTAPEDVSAVRYMTVVWPALLTLVVLVWRERALTSLAAFATGAAILGCLDLTRDSYGPDPATPDGREVDELSRFVRENGLDHGYAGYWDAASLTFQSDYEALTYPLLVCGAGGGGRCQYPYHTIDSWYLPKQGARTFYIEDSSGRSPAVGPPPARWGPPVAEANIGRLRVYAYDYDLALVLGERNGPPPSAASVRPVTGPARGAVERP